MRARLQWVLLTGLVFVAGYLAGRNGVAGRLRATLLPEPEPVEEAAPALLPALPFAERTSEDLHSLLDSAIVRDALRAALWTPLATETDPRARRQTRDAIERRLLERLGPPARMPGTLVQQSRWFERDGVSADLLRIAVGPAHLDAALFVPAKRPEGARRPAVIAIHGANGDLDAVARDHDYHHGFGFALAREGYTVLAPHMVASDSAPVIRTLYLKGLVAGKQLLSLELAQLMGAVDLLETLPSVDPRRIAVYGISRGGTHALLLGAADPRISAVVASGHFADRFERLFDPDTVITDTSVDLTRNIWPGQAPAYLPEMDLFLDDMNLVALIQPRSLAIVVGSQDQLLPSAQAEFESVRAVYRAGGVPERAAFITFEGGHETSVADVLPFLARWASDSTAAGSK